MPSIPDTDKNQPPISPEETIHRESDELPPEQPEIFIQKPAEPISAAELVADDKDRPVADNKLPPPPIAQPLPLPVSETKTDTPLVSMPGVSEAKKRGRKPYTPEQRAAIDAAKKTGAIKPDFSDLKKGATSQPGSPMLTVQAPIRNYWQEAASVFIPLSMVAGKHLGPHWGIKINQTTHQLDFTDEQKSYLNTMARWIEYEKFPPLNARYEMIIASIAYALPKTQIEPTPEKLKHVWISVSGFFKRLFKRKEKVELKKEDKHEDEP